MTEKYPTWLRGHVKEWTQKRLPTVSLCSTTGNDLLEIWFYGVKRQPDGPTNRHKNDPLVRVGYLLQETA